VFGIYYHDWRNVLATDNGPVALRRANIGNVRIGTFGGHYIHAVPIQTGAIDILLWGAGQSGRWGRQHHTGGVIALEGGWQPKAAKVKPWLRAGYLRGTGDNDPTDNKHKTFFQITPTPRPYARFPFFNMMNNEDFMGALLLRPRAKLTISLEAHALRLSNKNDLWYMGGGAFQPWTFGYVGRPSGGSRSLANLFDAGVEVRVNPKTTLGLYGGFAAGRSVVKSIYPGSANGGLAYVEVSHVIR
jgi:hypothetical protein